MWKRLVNFWKEIKFRLRPMIRNSTSDYMSVNYLQEKLRNNGKTGKD